MVGTMLLLAIAVCGAYVAGYFLLSTKIYLGSVFSGPIYIRYFKHDWQATIYRPAAKVECRLTGDAIGVGVHRAAKSPPGGQQSN